MHHHIIDTAAAITGARGIAPVRVNMSQVCATFTTHRAATNGAEITVPGAVSWTIGTMGD